MAHAESHEHLTPEQMKFREYFQRADDFRKIGLYRYSKYWFEEALKFNFDHDTVEQRLEMVDTLIKEETKLIIYVVSAAAVIILASMFIF
jgi:hypothetical protein